MLKLISYILSFAIVFSSVTPSLAQVQASRRQNSPFQVSASNAISDAVERMAAKALQDGADAYWLERGSEIAKEQCAVGGWSCMLDLLYRARQTAKGNIEEAVVCSKDGTECIPALAFAWGGIHYGSKHLLYYNENIIVETAPKFAELLGQFGVYHDSDRISARAYFKDLLINHAPQDCTNGAFEYGSTNHRADQRRTGELQAQRCAAEVTVMPIYAMLSKSAAEKSEVNKIVYKLMKSKYDTQAAMLVVQAGVTALGVLGTQEAYKSIETFLTDVTMPSTLGNIWAGIGEPVKVTAQNSLRVASNVRGGNSRYLNRINEQFQYLDQTEAKRQGFSITSWQSERRQYPYGNMLEDIGAFLGQESGHNAYARALAKKLVTQANTAAKNKTNAAGVIHYPVIVGILDGWRTQGKTFIYEPSPALLELLYRGDWFDLNEGTQRRIHYKAYQFAQVRGWTWKSPAKDPEKIKRSIYNERLISIGIGADAFVMVLMTGYLIASIPSLVRGIPQAVRTLRSRQTWVGASNYFKRAPKNLWSKVKGGPVQTEAAASKGAATPKPVAKPTSTAPAKSTASKIVAPDKPVTAPAVEPAPVAANTVMTVGDANIVDVGNGTLQWLMPGQEATVAQPAATFVSQGEGFANAGKVQTLYQTGKTAPKVTPSSTGVPVSNGPQPYVLSQTTNSLGQPVLAWMKNPAYKAPLEVSKPLRNLSWMDRMRLQWTFRVQPILDNLKIFGRSRYSLMALGPGAAPVSTEAAVASAGNAVEVVQTIRAEQAGFIAEDFLRGGSGASYRVGNPNIGGLASQHYSASALGQVNPAAVLPTKIVPIRVTGSLAFSQAGLRKVLGLSGRSGVLSMNGLGVGIHLQNRKLLARVNSKLEEAKAQANKQFVIQAKQAQQQGQILAVDAYDNLLSGIFSQLVADDSKLAPYAQGIQQAAQESLASTEDSPSRYVKEEALQIQDASGKLLPVTLTVRLNFLDRTAYNQFQKSDSETLTLMRLGADKPFELLFKAPYGTGRGLYKPFIEGGKQAVEALYYRLLNDYQAGRLEDPKNRMVTINLYSDNAAERATMYAGLTEGLGGFPQSTVAPLATALNITDPEKLQAGVSHSQLGNVASVVFSGLQKELGIKKTLELGLAVAGLGLAICGFALSLPTIAAKVGMLGTGTFVLGVGANGGVKSTNSIFAKELSNDNTTGTARMGFVNERASWGTMAGYLFFPISALAVFTGIQAFQWLYYGAMSVPLFALGNLMMSKVRNVRPSHQYGSGLTGATQAVAMPLYNVGKNIIHNVVFALTGGYKERVAQITEDNIIERNTKQYQKIVNSGASLIDEKDATAKPNKIKTLWVHAKAAISQYMLRMMFLVGLYHFAGMMYNSGPGSIIGKYISGEDGVGVVDAVRNSLPSAVMFAGVLGFFGAKILSGLVGAAKERINPDIANKEAIKGTTGNITATTKVRNFITNHTPSLVAAGAMAATALSPEVAGVLSALTQRLDTTAVAQLITFFPAYIGVWAGRKYLAQMVKDSKLSPQGIIGASGVLSSIAVGLAFIPGLPLVVRALFWTVAGLGFANLAGYENSLAMEKYPDNKPAVNMAYTLARLSGAATVWYGSLAKTMEAHGFAEPDVNALVLPAAALLIATLINGKFFTQNFIQDVKRWKETKPALNARNVRAAADEYYKKYMESVEESTATRAQDVDRIAKKLYNQTSHDLISIERLIAPHREKLFTNDLQLALIVQLRKLLGEAQQNQVSVNMPELNYSNFRRHEVEPLLRSLRSKPGLTKREEGNLIKAAATIIMSRYQVSATALTEIEASVARRSEGLDAFRLDVLKEMYRMQLTEAADLRAARYKGDIKSYNWAMKDLQGKAAKVLGTNHQWTPPAYIP